MATPNDLQNQTNAIQWTNGRGLITGAMVSGLVATIIGILTSMGTWDSSGHFEPSGTGANLTGILRTANNLSDVPSKPTARTNLGLAPVAASGNAADLASASAVSGSATVAQSQINATTIIATSFTGVDPTGASNSDTGFANFIAECVKGRDCFIPPGTYKFANDLIVDFAGHIGVGTRIYGAGQNATLLQFANGKHMQIECSTGTVGTPCPIFYPAFSNFGVLANLTTNAALNIGLTNNTDAFNGISVRDLWVKNLAAASGGTGLWINEAFSSVFDNVTTSAGCTDPLGNCASTADSLLVTNSAYDHFTGSFSGGRDGVRLSGSFVFGLVFDNPDLEVNYFDLAIDAANVHNNTFNGGQWNYYGNAIVASAGANNKINNPNYAPSNSGGVFAASTGIVTSVCGPTTTVAGNIVTWAGTDGNCTQDSNTAIGSLAPKASPALTGTPTAPTPATSNSSTQIATTANTDAKIAVAIAAGTSANMNSGYLSFVSTSQIKFCPFNGTYIRVGGAILQIPAACITLANTSLSASTKYYIVVQNSSGTPVLAAVAAGTNIHCPDTTSGNVGVEVTSSASTCTPVTGNTLVGLAQTNASSQFQAQGVGTISWFNRKPITLDGGAASISTGSSTNVELTASNRVTFVQWLDSPVQNMSGNGFVSNSGTSGVNSVQLAPNGTPVGVGNSSSGATANRNQPIGLSFGMTTGTEGTQFLTLYGNTSAGTMSGMVELQVQTSG